MAGDRKKINTIFLLSSMVIKMEKKNKKYLLSAFSPKMMGNGGAVIFYKLTPQEAKEIWNYWLESKYDQDYDKEVVIGHQSTADVFREYGFNGVTKAERKPVSLDIGDSAIVCMPSFRLPEGKVLNKEELTELIDSGKMTCYGLRVLRPLPDLSGYE